MNLAKRLIFNKYRVKKLLAISHLCWLYEGINEKNNERVAMKFEKIKAKHNLLESEAYILFNLKGYGIPKFITYGKSGLFNVLIEELLGASINSLWDLRKNKKQFRLKNICMLSLQLLDRLEYIHSKNYIHRDIKPNNVVIGRKDPKTIYLIDFGLAHQYRSYRTGKHIKFKNIKKTFGNVRFLSTNGSGEYEQSRRDDLESLGYMAIYLATGYLPWGNTAQLKINNCIRFQAIYKLKKSITTEKLCQGLPEEFCSYINYCKNLEFEEDPNYDYLRNLFTNILIKNSQINDLQFFWINNKKLKKFDEKSADSINISYKRKGNSKKRLYNQIKKSLEKSKSQDKPIFLKILQSEHVNSLNINSFEKKNENDNINNQVFNNNLSPKRNIILIKKIPVYNINKINKNNKINNSYNNYNNILMDKNEIQNKNKIKENKNIYIVNRNTNSKINDNMKNNDKYKLKNFDNKSNSSEPFTDIDLVDKHISNNNYNVKFKLNEINNPKNLYSSNLNYKVDNIINYTDNNLTNSNINYNLKSNVNNQKKKLLFKNYSVFNFGIKKNANYKTLYEREKEKDKYKNIDINENSINLNNSDNINKILKKYTMCNENKVKKIIKNKNKGNSYNYNINKEKSYENRSNNNIFNNIVNNSVFIFNKNMSYSNSQQNLYNNSQMNNINDIKSPIKDVCVKNFFNPYKNQYKFFPTNPNIKNNSNSNNLRLKKNSKILNIKNIISNTSNYSKNIIEKKLSNNFQNNKIKIPYTYKNINENNLLVRNITYNKFNSPNLSNININNKIIYNLCPNSAYENNQNRINNNIKNFNQNYN